MSELAGQSQLELWRYLNAENPQAQTSPQKQTLELLHTSLLAILGQRDKDIQSLEQDLTKCRCELAKTNKQLKELQEKCSMGASNSNNTGSNFMLPAEFKTKFETFMKQTVSGALTGLTHRPKSYVFLLQEALQMQYSKVEIQLQETLQQISSTLKLQNSPTIHKILFAQLLKPLQDNHALLFKLDSQSSIKQLESTAGLDQQLLEVIQSLEFGELLEELNQLVTYMVLQQARWQFLLPHKKVVEYSKKEQTCVDGWIKEQEKVIVLVEGLRRMATTGGFTVHQQLKNFVIPYTDEAELTPKAKEQEIVKQSQPDVADKVLPRSLTLVSTIVGVHLEPKPFQLQISISERKIEREASTVHNNFAVVPTVPVPPAVRMKELLESLPLKKSTIDQEAKKKKPAASKISGLLTDPSFSEQLLTTKRHQKKDESSCRLLDAQFQSRIVNREIRTNTALERNRNGVLKKQKSIGKIIHQLSKLSLKDEQHVATNHSNAHGQSHNRCASNKQNLNVNSKQAIYKSIICSQLRQERAVIKLRQPRKQESIFSQLLMNSKTDRQDKENSRKREENRPLKPSQEHMQRVREKHHLLY